MTINTNWVKISIINKDIIENIRSEYYAEDIAIPDDIVGWTENDFKNFFESGGTKKPRMDNKEIVVSN
tara:strand:- start:289 stop:492 length:204 start_codon:yes stop_codon:yes gene_type:complete